MTYQQKTLTKDFWDKSLTKNWLQANTTFKYPKTVTKPAFFNETFDSISTLPDGDYVLKPNAGRKSAGIILFTKKNDCFELFPTSDSHDHKQFKDFANKKASFPQFHDELVKQHVPWFVEEWVFPHERFLPFTDFRKCPPILRFCGRPAINIIGFSPIYTNITGLSTAGWKNRKYIWLDTEGFVRSSNEMNLLGIDPHTIEVVNTKSLQDPPIGLKIDGIPEVIAQIEKEICPKIHLYQSHTWCCDGIFNENDEFVVIELNHGPGIQFRGFQWK